MHPLVKHTDLFINNEFVPSETKAQLRVVNPATTELICSVSKAEKGDVDRAVAAAKAAFNPNAPWRTMTGFDRGVLIHKLADLMTRDCELIANIETLDSGKPISRTRVEMSLAANTMRYFAGYADKIHGNVIPGDTNRMNYTRAEPIGVCAAIVAWNYPILLMTWKLGPILATGNTTVLKPSEKTPLSTLYIGKLIVEAGFPPGVVNFVCGAGETGTFLVTHPLVEKVSFTGSHPTGIKVQQSVANSSYPFKKLTLELGGKSPVIVCEDVKDVKQAAALAQEACMSNMGQCCCAGTRTFVQEGIYDAFVAASAELAKARIVGSPSDPKTDQGAIVDDLQFNRVMQYIAIGQKEGARCVAGGRKASAGLNAENEPGYFIEPTVFADVTDGMRIAREEIFGPVQQILKFKTLDEVIERANDTIYGLGAGVITDDIKTALRLTNELNAGSVWVNCYGDCQPQVPFGGFKYSGIGKELGEESLHDYLRVKSVVIALD